MARADLAAARDTIRKAHPGVIDEQNPAFNDWVERGYEEASRLVPYVMSYDTALQAVRYYTTGFNDGHLSYSDDVRSEVPIWVTGWMVEARRGEYVVTATLPGWPESLPTEGAVWLGCDGHGADDLLSRDIGPFVRRGDGTHARTIQAAYAWLRRPVEDNFKECDFRGPDQAVIRLPVAFRPITMPQFFSTISRSNRDGNRTAANDFETRDGVLWVRARSFNLQDGTDALSRLEGMLTDLERTSDARVLVFDVRGNGGGDSSIGDRIFDAATGGLDVDPEGIDALPRYYAQWRVSDHLLGYLDSMIARSASLYGPASARVAEDEAFRDRVRAAMASGHPWVEQDAGHTMTPAEVIRRNGRLRRPRSAVVLLTDEHCVSACLDFADRVLQVPGAVHMGQTTGADSVYMVGSVARLPSGNALRVPVKVWRNRPRANNESYVPTVRIDLHLDEATIRQTVLDALRNR